METTLLMSKAILSALKRRKKFSSLSLSLSHVLFELSEFEEGATEKSQKIK